MLLRRAAELHRLLEVITRLPLGYLNAQVPAGAQAVMVFDTWGGALTPRTTASSRCATCGASSRA